MPTIKKTEKVRIQYSGNRITAKGTTFDIAIDIDSTSLASVYMLGHGEAKSTITIEVPDVKEQPEVTEDLHEKKKKFSFWPFNR